MEFYASIKNNDIMQDICRKMDAIGNHYIKRNKPGSERQMATFLSYTQFTFNFSLSPPSSPCVCMYVCMP